ncbi:hypothetical protein Fmac_030144 [Flemingia macrophylla]|uniref:non-specific serine/threonine protein kinase n=1 Tax=Flemingia macrophylla TaxID=520843 RepID=A0ABD1LCD5_9FABA
MRMVRRSEWKWVCWLLAMVSTLPHCFCDFNYSVCKDSLYSCGTLSDISYPFWGQNRPSQCGGGETFKLSCQGDGNTSIRIGSQSFRVKEINMENESMRLVQTEFGDDVCSLPSGFEDIYVKPTQFLYSNSLVVYNITIFSGCGYYAHDPYNESHSFKCGDGHDSYAYYVIDDQNEWFTNQLSYACKGRLHVPTDYEGNPQDALTRVLGKGFEVKYDVDKECTKCLRRGDCWKDDAEKHVNSCYYCPDGSRALRCSQSHKTTTVLSSNPKFETCTPRSCGAGPLIKYPFWIPYQQESFCGYPHFEITCIDKNPILRTADNDLLVKDISYSNSSFTVANIAVYEDKCPVPMYNYSLDQTPFSYSSENWNLSFFYNCTTEPIDYPTYKVDCAKNATHYSFAVFHKEALEHKNYSLHECQFMVNVPLHVNAAVNFSSLLRTNYSEILKMGFLLNWTAPDCQYCEKSGGRCGFDGNQILCFCKDKSYLKSCSNASVSAVVGALAVVIVGVYLFKRRKKNSYDTYIQSRSLSFDQSSKGTEKRTQSFTQSFVHGMHLSPMMNLKRPQTTLTHLKNLERGALGQCIMVETRKLRDGRSVAVKRLYENNYRRVEQFMNEIKILALLKHPNLVSLYGCTSRHSRELLLVYEYIPNGTVADHLHGERTKPGTLPWVIRMNIAMETASALTYLHVKDIIHRDVKTNNILLDSNFRVKVADFGLSRLFPEDVTHVSTAPQGTPGYVDPEYHQCYQLTNKSDVYSFGVVLVELISSLPAVDITRHRHEINLANMAINKIHSQALHEFVDPTLGFESDFKVRKMINAVAELAFQCLQSSRDMRPSMEEVFDTLKDIQSDGKHKSQPEVMDMSGTADDVVLLKDDPPPPSPESNGVSKSTTPNASG